MTTDDALIESVREYQVNGPFSFMGKRVEMPVDTPQAWLNEIARKTNEGLSTSYVVGENVVCDLISYPYSESPVPLVSTTNQRFWAQVLALKQSLVNDLPNIRIVVGEIPFPNEKGCRVVFSLGASRYREVKQALGRGCQCNKVQIYCCGNSMGEWQEYNQEGVRVYFALEQVGKFCLFAKSLNLIKFSIDHRSSDGYLTRYNCELPLD